MMLNNLSKHLKDSTNTNEYNKIFLETISPLKKDWEIIFTDGSKTDTCTSFAVTNAEGVTIYAGILPRFTSIFTAEAAALLEAVIFASQKCSKHLICTDSKSSIEAILNPTNDTPMVTKIRNIISIHTSEIKIMWIPGHSGINGNEKTDKRAKEANKEPLHTFNYITCNDIKILAKELAADNAATKWNIYQHPYKNFNPFGEKISTLHLHYVTKQKPLLG
ncbi:uncharacterized protein LOC128865921 isoform X1 [Anastrepha ludens]|uniref:uncharacterized protein LOC128865921 isoform X1 n=1 Tax=Anastrepha ludens TaxID=28586 RepID=UPI0023AF76D6|nr:uncharacterized protein LOC128865921 isoform X1 [Anastrepha ludens]